MTYELELRKVVNSIKKAKAKLVLLQLPEAIKPRGTEITKLIEKETNAKCIIWMGTCFGACDLPNIENIKPKPDMIIHWGHTRFKK